MIGQILLAALIVAVGIYAVWVIERHTPWKQYQAGAQRAIDDTWEDLFVDCGLGPEACPDCKRNAGHDSGCTQVRR
jgi:hypothetical protein